MNRSILLLALTGLLAACSNDPTPMASAGAVAGAASTPSVFAQCGKDTDCKGDRVCEKGACTAPAAVLGAEPSSTQPAASSPVATALPLCQAKDARVRIAVWTPTNKKEDGDDWTPAPPQNEGQIVYIDAAQWTESGCGVDKLNTLSFPEDPNDVMQGGLAVNLRGNTQVTDGLCYYKGFFRNESVPGVHQGWVETFFGAVDKDEVLKSDRYCLERPLP